MKFGIFYEHQLPRPWHERSEYELLQQLARRRSSSPTASATTTPGRSSTTSSRSTRTPRRPRSSSPPRASAPSASASAHGIVQLTTNHPARVAERVCTLDLLSPRARRARHRRGLERHRAASLRSPLPRQARGVGGRGARGDPDVHQRQAWEYHGEYFDFPLRNVLPKPYQKPHPPLWVACSQLETIEMAGRRGMGALGFQFVSAEAAHAWVHTYYNAFVKRLDKLTDYRRTRTSRWSAASCAPRPTRRRCARPTAGPSSSSRCASTASTARSAPGSVNLWEEYQGWKETAGGPEAAPLGSDRLSRDAAARSCASSRSRTSTR